MTDFEVTITEKAQETIRAMHDEVRRIDETCVGDPFYQYRAALSLAKSLLQMLNLKPSYIGKDGEFSLICSTPHGFTFGVNYTGTQNEYKAGEWSVNS